MEMFVIRPKPNGDYETISSTTSLRAWRRDQITTILQAQEMCDTQ